MVRSANKSEPINISLRKDQILQRFLARRIWKENELRVIEVDGTDHTGFITGLDERCIQMSTTPAHQADEPHSVLLFWPVRRIEETGRHLEDLDYEHVSRIRSFGQVLWKRCDAAMRNTGVARHNNGHSPRVDPASSLFSEL